MKLIAVDTSTLKLRSDFRDDIKAMGASLTPDEEDQLARWLGWYIFDDEESLKKAKQQLVADMVRSIR